MTAPAQHAPARATARKSALALGVLLALAAACSWGEVVVREARIRALIAGQHTTAAYFELHNRGAGPVTLVGAESPAAGAIEMHRVVRDGDMVRMRRTSEVVIAAGDTVRFAPGGLHLMLFRVTALDAETPIVLLLDGGNRVPVTFRQIPIGAQ